MNKFNAYQAENHSFCDYNVPHTNISRSMTDLVNDSTAQSPKRKFSFRFPHLVHHSSSGGDKDSSSSGNGQHSKGMHGAKMRNFSEEVKNVPDLQVNETTKVLKLTFIYTHYTQMHPFIVS